ncbi:YkgJ family cysteine cluster protein [Vibrio fluvialis]|uniref:YkgJ family cysteine cluster protein n=1 Tax=Vibrio chagasii TaxID=170679 RepID=UPI001C9CC45C|nr:YkgJ family cysteine cluster protein [Vibrio fluvialis]MBY8089087.1 YkgJ family cysteine cluster protein [Vibrio fluvialis]MBY8279153.1 YkgJ family cysteine cluster protein [Vibrio fluvialis]
MECRLGCGACCVAPSISSLGKPANIRCKYLDDNNLCSIFGKPERPKVCSDFKAEAAICGTTNREAMDNLIYLESVT